MNSTISKMELAMDLLRAQGWLRPRDLIERGIPSDYLDRLYRRGIVDRVARGLYVLPGFDVGEFHSFAEAARLVPRGVVCLLSALRFHGITSQSPREIWLAFPNKAWTPKIDRPRLRIVRFSGDALTHLVERHVVEGTTVKVYSPAKTVADCFKYRNKIGLDVAIEALQDSWRQKKVTMDELWLASSICRMKNVMRPYIESLV